MVNGNYINAYEFQEKTPQIFRYMKTSEWNEYEFEIFNCYKVNKIVADNIKAFVEFDLEINY